MSEVTVCLTSCGRPDLLEITLDSFFKFNTYPIYEFFIYEDTPMDTFPIKNFRGVQWILNNSRKGQIHALDSLFAEVTTPYIFHLEDDWKFLKGGFIEKSMKILEKHPDILQVRLCHLEKHSQHPVEYSKGFGVLKTQPDLWSGTNFNPSLKRKSDYDLIAPFSKHTTFRFDKPWKAEAAISKVYHKLGFKAAILSDEYIKHIGEGRHVS